MVEGRAIGWTRAIGSLLLVATAALADPRPASLQGRIGRSLDPVGIRSDAALQAFAARYIAAAGASLLVGSASLGQIGAIDATMETTGPIFLAHPQTLGRGQANVSLLGQTSLLDAGLAGPGALVIARQQDEFAAAIGYRLKLRVADAALAMSYGLTDRLDVSLLLLVVHAALQIDVTRAIVQQRVAGAFVPTRRPVVRRTETVSHTGFGDLTLRLKYGLPPLGAVAWAAALDAQFPTGVEADLSGTGDYWLTPSLDFHLPLGPRADATLNLGFDVDVSRAHRSQAAYGIGMSVLLVPRRLVGVVEFLGRSDLAAQPTPRATDALYLLPDGTVAARPLFGFTVGRADTFDLSFGFRVVLASGVIAFATALYELNTVGLHGGRVIPSVGVGRSF